MAASMERIRITNPCRSTQGAHNLRHTFGRRLRSAGVPRETCKVLLGHANGDITTHYSAAELEELLEAVNKIDNRNIGQTPTLTIVSQHRQKGIVGKVSAEAIKISGC